MSATSSPSDQLVELHARIAEFEAMAARKDQYLADRDTEVKRLQSHLLRAQAQIMELGDILAARDTALKNAEAGAPDLQRILDAQLARTNELDARIRETEEREAGVRLELASALERATHAERRAREAIAAVHQENTRLSERLQAVTSDLEGRQADVAKLESLVAELRLKAAMAETSADELRQRTETAEKLNAAQGVRLRKMESHWVWRATRIFHE